MQKRRIQPIHQVFVPEWKYCYYNYDLLNDQVELLQMLSTLYDEIRKKTESSSFQFKCDYALEGKYQALTSISKKMQEVNEMFFVFREDEIEVIHYFSTMKFIELRQKFYLYKKVSRFVPKDDEDTLTLLENIYIELSYLQILINDALYKDDKILKIIKQFTDKFEELETPITTFSNSRDIQRTVRCVKKEKAKIQDYYFSKKKHVTEEERKKFKYRPIHRLEMGKNAYLLFGLVNGLVFFALVVLILFIDLKNLDPESNTSFSLHFPIWRGLSYVIFYVWVIGIDLLVFEYFKINYKKILHLDKHRMPSSGDVLVFAAIATLVFLILFILYILALSEIISPQAMKPEFYPAMGWGLLILLLFFPLQTQYFDKKFRARKYTQTIILSMILSFIIGVNYTSNWLSEQLISFKQPFQDVAYSVLFYTNPDPDRNLPLLIGSCLATSIFALRILQGFRRTTCSCDKKCFRSYFIETPLFRGAVKCLLNIITIWASYAYKQNKKSILAWAICAAFSTTYAYLFDIFFDWDLLFIEKSINKYGCFSYRIKFRKMLFFESRVPYIFFGILNLILRVSWLFTISTQVVEGLVGNKNYLFIMATSYLQLIRIGIWNVFMIEKDHIKNSQQFDAIVNYEQTEQRLIRRFKKTSASHSYEKMIEKLAFQKSDLNIMKKQTWKLINKTENNKETNQKCIEENVGYIKRLKKEYKIKN